MPLWWAGQRRSSSFTARNRARYKKMMYYGFVIYIFKKYKLFTE